MPDEKKTNRYTNKNDENHNYKSNNSTNFNLKKQNYQNTTFKKSAYSLKDCPPSEKEVAFAGRSNSGKSSALNALTRSSKLSKTSKTPGRTQLINFFSLTENKYLVDLPGYGYAKVPKKMKLDWQKNINTYLTYREPLIGVVLLVDCRHEIKPFDQMLIQWSTESKTYLHILLTKSDKLKSGAQKQKLVQLDYLIKPYSNISCQLFSATKNRGIDTLTSKLDQWLL